MKQSTQYILVFALVVCAFGQIFAQTDTTKHQPTRQELYDQFHGTNKPKDNKNKKVKYIPTTAEELMKYDMETKAANKPAPDDHLVRSAWGIRLGMGLAGSTNNTYSLFKTNTTGNILGLNIGAVFAHRLSETIWVQPELLFVQKGTRLIGETGLDIDASVNTIQIPLLLKASFGKKTQWFLNAGPFVALALDGSLTGMYNGKNYDEQADYANNGGRIETGLAIGGGVSIPSQVGRFQLEWRYDVGLGTNSKVSGLTDKLYVASLSLAYLMPVISNKKR